MTESWNEPGRTITPEPIFFNRRTLLRTVGFLGGAAVLGGCAVSWWGDWAGDDGVLATGLVPEAPGAELYPANRADLFQEADRPLTSEAAAARNCNFYEFSSTKAVYKYVADFQPVPWAVEVSGLVRQPRTFDLDDLVRLFPLEERVYRHRCVEAWAMVVPWTGFPLASLLRMVDPLPEAKYVRFVSLDRPRGWVGGYPWPYTEGLTLAEARNPLTLLATGIYGKPLRKQHGAPVRLVVPWKYGFKGAKSLVRIELTATQPATFWNTLAPNEYDFWANVNPDVPHPRWSQRRERMLGTGEMFDTRKFNGYGEWVADLYLG
jgi:sulfoxide reductase catalytic subunit YedY